MNTNISIKCSRIDAIDGMFFGDWESVDGNEFVYNYHLTDTFKKWASDTLTGTYSVDTIDLWTVEILFENELDKTMFVLRWK